MKLVVHPHLHGRRTGVTSHVEAMLRSLTARFEARAYTGRGAAGVLESEVPVIARARLLERARAEPAIWHAHRNHELLLGLWLRLRAPRLRVVFTRHAAHTPGRWTRWLAARADRRVVLTPEGLHDFPGQGTEVVPHGVELSRFHPPEDRAAAWAERGVGGRFGVGVIGRIRRSKGQQDFARAWAEARHADWRAVLIGPVKRRQQRLLREVLAQGGEGLSWVGEQSDPAPWYRGLSVVAQPSHSEGFSLVLLEAMASGCCVVAARLPHFPRWVEHGQTGLLYPPGDVEALAGHLRFLFANRDKAHAMGARAAARAREEMGVEHEAAALGRLYDGLLEGG